ncbi:MAG TPA: hypothetical protein VEY07_04340 [Thermoplasmata archaeon]|nr:hypothetical protein [Thermoplasmata archaeon]
MTGKRAVLFVCVENSCRSLMAEAIFNADPPNGWIANSAGTQPARQANGRTAPMLREIGVEMPEHPPQRLTDEAIDGASIRITMGCLDHQSCPARLRGGRLTDWELPDPANLDDAAFRGVRDEIRRRVAALRDEIESGASAQ